MTQDAKTYRTRNGIVTAEQAASDMLESATFRLRFLQEMFEAIGEVGEGLTLPGYTACGLAGILSDIAFDVGAADTFYRGDDNEPGKTDDVVKWSDDPAQ